VKLISNASKKEVSVKAGLQLNIAKPTYDTCGAISLNSVELTNFNIIHSRIFLILNLWSDKSRMSKLWSILI